MEEQSFKIKVSEEGFFVEISDDCSCGNEYSITIEYVNYDYGNGYKQKSITINELVALRDFLNNILKLKGIGYD